MSIEIQPENSRGGNIRTDGSSDQSGTLGASERREGRDTIPPGGDSVQLLRDGASKKIDTINEFVIRSRGAVHSDKAPCGMSRFQIERFIVGTEAPHERYFRCCVEINARMSQLSDIDIALNKPKDSGAPPALDLQRSKDATLYELEVFVDLAERWFPLTDGYSYEELQPIIWDETLTYRLCLAVLSGKPVFDVIGDVMTMPESSMCQRLLVRIMKADHGEVHPDAMRADVVKTLSDFQREYPLIENKKEE